MDTSGVDPHVAELTVQLGQTAARNAAGPIFDKIRTSKAKKVHRDTINELEEIVRDLIDDRNELVQIAQGFEQELVAQRLSDDDIAYIINTIIPVVKKLIEKSAASGDAEAAKKMQDSLDLLEPVLSVETLTVMQLIGFNIKEAIGEPLTLLVQNFITAQRPADPQITMEITRLGGSLNLELVRIAQSEESTVRLNRVLANWRGGN